MNGSVTTNTLAWKSPVTCGSTTLQAPASFGDPSCHVVGTESRHPLPLRSTKPATAGGGTNEATRACLGRLHPAPPTAQSASAATAATARS